LKTPPFGGMEDADLMKRIIFPLLALLAGGLGAAAQLWRLQGALEPDTLLLNPDHPSGLLLRAAVVLAVVLAVLGALLCRGRTMVQVPWRSMSLGARLGLSLAGAAYLAAGIYQLVTLPLTELSLSGLLGCYLPLLTGIASLGSGIGLLLLVWQPTMGNPTLAANLAMLPGLTYALLLVCLYQEFGSDPALWHFMWVELALLLAMLAWFGYARLLFASVPAPRLTLLALLAISALLIALPTASSPNVALILGGNLLWLLLRSCQQLRALPSSKGTA
jgi:hypothetical protein